MWAVITFVALCFVYFLDVFHFKGHVPGELIPFVYILFVLGSLFVLVYIFNFIKIAIFGASERNKNIRLVLEKYKVEEKNRVGIRIYNDYPDDLINCYMLLTHLTQK